MPLSGGTLQRHYGVAQGSVLGPLPFTIYVTSPIDSVIAPFRNVHHAQYADDTQLYITLTRHSALSMTVSSPSIVGWTVGRQRALSESRQNRSDRHWYHCQTKVGTTSRRHHSRRRHCSCYKNSKESRCDNRQHSVIRRSR